MNTDSPERLPPMDLTWVRWLLESYAFWLKRELIDRTGTMEEQGERLYFAPFVVASHVIPSTQLRAGPSTRLRTDPSAGVLRPGAGQAGPGSEDPILNYGNRQALALWEMTWQEFTATPSRLTAEPVNQTERARMLDRVTTHGFMTDYRGVRISRTGRRFLVQQATVWNVLDDHGNTRGQAATFSHWHPLTED